MEPVWIGGEPAVGVDENGHPVVRVELAGGCDEEWERLFGDHGFGSGFPYPMTFGRPAVVELVAEPGQVGDALDWLWRRVQMVNEAVEGADRRGRGQQVAVADAVHVWWEAHRRGRRPTGASPRCPACGTRLLAEPVPPTTGPGVASCPGCGAEVPFGGGGAGETGGRITLADRTHPAADTMPRGGAGWATCWNCSARVPLTGASPAELTGQPPSDVADTVTCPRCGVEVPAIADPEAEGAG